MGAGIRAAAGALRTGGQRHTTALIRLRRSTGKDNNGTSGSVVSRTRAIATFVASCAGRIIGYSELKPHDLRHGVAMEVLEQHHDLEEVRALLGHVRIDTTQIYTSIRPAQLKRAVSFYEERATKILSE